MMSNTRSGSGHGPLYLSECTLLEVKAHLERSPKVVIPVGSTEQHGPHSPYGTESNVVPEPLSLFASNKVDTFYQELIEGLIILALLGIYRQRLKT